MEPAQTWLSEPDRLMHIAASCVVFYYFIIILVRLSGKRTTGNMNNFDWIITVAIGSIMASGLLLRNVSMLDAMLAVSVLAILQWLTTWSALRSKRFARLVKPQPRMLLKDGRLLERDMTYERVTEDEVKSALRAAGLAGTDAAAWVVMETNGTLSVIEKPDHTPTSSDLLEGVARRGDHDTGKRDTRGET